MTEPTPEATVTNINVNVEPELKPLSGAQTAMTLAAALICMSGGIAAYKVIKRKIVLLIP